MKEGRLEDRMYRTQALSTFAASSGCASMVFSKDLMAQETCLVALIFHFKVFEKPLVVEKERDI
jgi:hypothetical protein